MPAGTKNRAEQPQHHRAHQCEHKVGRRASCGNRHHAKARVVQSLLDYGHWLGPAEHRQTGQRQTAGNQQGTNRINVADGVERQPLLLLCGGITQHQSGPPMRYFVKHDGDDQTGDQNYGKSKGFNHNRSMGVCAIGVKLA